MPPSPRGGNASWHSFATTAESMPPLKPNTYPRAPADIARSRNQVEIFSARVIGALVLRQIIDRFGRRRVRPDKRRRGGILRMCELALKKHHFRGHERQLGPHS